MSTSYYTFVGEFYIGDMPCRLYKADDGTFAVFKLDKTHGIPESQPTYTGTLTTVCVWIAFECLKRVDKNVIFRKRREYDKTKFR